MSSSDASIGLGRAALGQEAVRQAPAIFVVAAVCQRIAQEYGDEPSPRYVHLEAGHAAQNQLLEAVASDLGALPIGALSQDEMQQVVGRPADHEPLYLIAVGHPWNESL